MLFLITAGSSKDPSQEGNSFTILSYNVLAQQLLEDHHYLYRSHDSRALSWDYRSSVLLKEIKEAGADVSFFNVFYWFLSLLIVLFDVLCQFIEFK